MIPTEIDFKINSNSSIICCGSSNAGKSSFIINNFINNAENIFTNPPHKIVYIYTVFQKKFEDCQKKNANVHFTDSLENIRSHLDKKEQTLIIIDDAQNRITSPESLEHIEFLFMIATNHLNLTLIVVLHSWSVPKLRLCLNQASYVFFFRVRDVSALIQLNKESFPYARGFLIKCYRNITYQKYTPVILVFHCDVNCPYVRNELLPSPNSEIYFPKYESN